VAAGGDVIGVAASLSTLASIEGAIEFIFEPQSSNVTGGNSVGGIDQVVELTINQIELTVLALALSLLVALPIGLYLGHRGVGELFALTIGSAGRAVPELALIALMATAIGVGVLNLTIALAVLGVPPILANTFVGIHQVDRGTVDAARGMGMTEFEILRKVEVPLAIPTLFAGIRGAAIAIVATATIAPIAGVLTLGDFILNQNVYGTEGVLAGAILVALLALVLEFSLAGLQRFLTSPGLRPKGA
jgi:osmoprotectant transport system permease protein